MVEFTGKYLSSSPDGRIKKDKDCGETGKVRHDFLLKMLQLHRSARGLRCHNLKMVNVSVWTGTVEELILSRLKAKKLSTKFSLSLSATGEVLQAVAGCRETY